MWWWFISQKLNFVSLLFFLRVKQSNSLDFFTFIHAIIWGWKCRLIIYRPFTFFPMILFYTTSETNPKIVKTINENLAIAKSTASIGTLVENFLHTLIIALFFFTYVIIEIIKTIYLVSPTSDKFREIKVLIMITLILILTIWYWYKICSKNGKKSE